MPPVSELVIAGVIGAAAFLAAVISYRTWAPILRQARPEVIGPGLIVATIWTFIVRPHPTGTLVIDVTITVLVTALVGWAAATTGRYPLLTASLLAFVAAPDTVAAPAAVGLALAGVVLSVRVPPIKALAGGLVAVAAAQAMWVGPRPLQASCGLVAVVVPLLAAYQRGSRESRRLMLGGTFLALATATVALAGFGVAALSARPHVNRGLALTSTGLAAVRAGDATGAQSALDAAAAELALADRRVQAWWARGVEVLPVAAQNGRAVRAMAASGRRLTASAAAAAAAGSPSDLQIRDATLPLTALARLRPPLEDLVESLTVSAEQLERAQSGWLLAPVDDPLQRLRSDVDRETGPAAAVLNIARVLPGLFGGEGPRQYFLALQTPAELRASGGIIGSYGVLQAVDGRLALTTVGSASELNETGDPAARRLEGPSDYVARYGGYHPELAWQNITMSPDFPTVGEVIRSLYGQVAGQEIDGVIALDPRGVRAVLEVVGPVNVPEWPVPITPTNVESVLLHEQYLRYPTDETGRKQLLESLLRVTFDQLTTTALPAPRRLAEIFAPMAQERRLLLWSPDGAEQTVFRQAAADGGISPVQGDYLAVVNQNSSGNKIDYFLRRSTSYRVDFDPSTGNVRAKVTVSLRNLAPSRGLPPLIIGDLGKQPNPPGFNRTLLSIYTPFDLDHATVNGEALTMQGERERSRNVFSAFLSVPPEGTTVVELELHGALPSGDYRLDLGSQALAEAEEMAVDLTVPAPWSLQALVGFGGEGPTLRSPPGGLRRPTTLRAGATPVS